MPLLIFSLAIAVVACDRFASPAAPLAAASASPSSPAGASATATPPPSATASTTPTLPGRQEIWENFLPPQLTPITPIPPPLTGLVIPEEVKVLAIAGADRPLPYTGRTDAIALVIYHPRLARASLVSVPPDLFGYIPGHTMQRLYVAYPVGGARTLNSALEYNLGIKPDNFAVFNLNSFSQLIDDLGGINVTVLENVTAYCKGILPGTILLNGEQALCYMRLRLGEDELARNRRQQEVLRTVFLRLVEGGNLVRVPQLYNQYRSSIDSDLTLEQIMDAMPLAIKLGDPNRIGYFQPGSDQLKVWQISEDPQASVFLPNRPALMKMMQQAVNFVTTPSPLSEVVVTLEYQLTISPTPTATYTRTPTPTRTLPPPPTATRTRAATTATATTLTPTATVTITPQGIWTRTPTLNVTQ